MANLNSLASILASIKQEPLSSPQSLPPPELSLLPPPLAVVKTEPHQPEPPPPEPIPLPLAVVKTEPEPEPEQQQPQPQQQPNQEEQQQLREPQFLKSIDDLASLSSAIQAFKCRFDELNKHLEFINHAINSKFNEQQRPQNEIEAPPKSTEADTKTEKTGPDSDPLPRASRTEIQSLCETMCSKGLRKYIVTHLSNVLKLREEVPAALKLAPRPAKLVLDCIGRFFLQGIKAYTKDSPMIPARQASVLVLEYFLLMMADFRGGEGKFKIGGDIKEEAEKGAVAWRKRLISEGGLGKASEVDARGLLLYVACFGIPKVFRNEDLGNLLRLCNLRAISDALKGSRVLPTKIAAIIEAMAKNGMHAEAVDVASIFGLEDVFSPKAILSLFMQESTKTFKREKLEAQNSPVELRKANEKQLDAMKSIVQYLETRNTDVTKLLGGWQIEEKIVKLEEEIAELNKRIEDMKMMIPKRKLDEMGSSSRVKSQDMKRSRFAPKGSPLPKSSLVNGLHEQRIATLGEGVRSYDGLVPNSYDNAIPGRVTNYLAASAGSQGSIIGSLPENGVGPMVGMTGVGSSGAGTGIGVIPTNSYSGVHGEIEVAKAAQMMSHNGLPYGWQQGSVRQSASASMRFGDFFGSSSSVEGFVGLPDSTDRTAADLYRFADSIRENEIYNKSSSSNRTNTLPTVAPARNSSYMYQ